jgi:hypothetical protein
MGAVEELNKDQLIKEYSLSLAAYVRKTATLEAEIKALKLQIRRACLILADT